MVRREFLKITSGPLAVCLAGASNTASALLNCSPFNFQGLQQCEAGLNSQVADVTAGSVGGQQMTQWCWAACIEMVFRFYGLRVAQRDIVQQTWGSIVNLPGQPQQILMNLNRPWTDSTGRMFYVSGDAFSANPITASQDLSNNMPLIIGTMGHAMVLTSLTYMRDQVGRGDVTAAVVRDPWLGRGRRVLSAQEWYNTSFLARIRVQRA